MKSLVTVYSTGGYAVAVKFTTNLTSIQGNNKTSVYNECLKMKVD